MLSRLGRQHRNRQHRNRLHARIREEQRRAGIALPGRLSDFWCRLNRSRLPVGLLLFTILAVLAVGLAGWLTNRSASYPAAELQAFPSPRQIHMGSAFLAWLLSGVTLFGAGLSSQRAWVNLYFARLDDSMRHYFFWRAPGALLLNSAVSGLGFCLGEKLAAGNASGLLIPLAVLQGAWLTAVQLLLARWRAPGFGSGPILTGWLTVASLMAIPLTFIADQSGFMAGPWSGLYGVVSPAGWLISESGGSMAGHWWWLVLMAPVLGAGLASWLALLRAQPARDVVETATLMGANAFPQLPFPAVAEVAASFPAESLATVEDWQIAAVRRRLSEFQQGFAARPSGSGPGGRSRGWRIVAAVAASLERLFASVDLPFCRSAMPLVPGVVGQVMIAWLVTVAILIPLVWSVGLIADPASRSLSVLLAVISGFSASILAVGGTGGESGCHHFPIPFFRGSFAIMIRGLWRIMTLGTILALLLVLPLAMRGLSCGPALTACGVGLAMAIAVLPAAAMLRFPPATGGSTRSAGLLVIAMTITLLIMGPLFVFELSVGLSPGAIPILLGGTWLVTACLWGLYGLVFRMVRSPGLGMDLVEPPLGPR